MPRNALALRPCFCYRTQLHPERHSTPSSARRTLDVLTTVRPLGMFWTAHIPRLASVALFLAAAVFPVAAQQDPYYAQHSPARTVVRPIRHSSSKSAVHPASSSAYKDGYRHGFVAGRIAERAAERGSGNRQTAARLCPAAPEPPAADLHAVPSHAGSAPSAPVANTSAILAAASQNLTTNANSLRGSYQSLARQNARLELEGLERIEDTRDLDARIAHGLLVPLPGSAWLVVNPDLPRDRRYCRPWTADFLTDLAHAHQAVFHSPLQVNSAVRTVSYQKQLARENGNAAPADGDVVSPHLSGAAVDLGKHNMSQQELAWMRRALASLQKAGKIDVEEEFQQACFHITVYREYAANRTPDLMPHPRRQARPTATAKTAARVRQPRRHSTARARPADSTNTATTASSNPQMARQAPAASPRHAPPAPLAKPAISKQPVQVVVDGE